MVRRLRPLLGLMAALLAGCAPVTPGSSGPSGSVSLTESGVDVIGTASADTSPTEPAEPPDPRIRAEAMLTADDVGAGYTAEDEPVGTDHGSIGMMLAYCGVYDYSEAANHEITYRQGSVAIDLGVGVDAEQYVLETVTRYESGWAQRYLDDVAMTMPSCPSIPIMGDPNNTAIMAIIDTDFAGDGSLLIRDEDPRGVQFHAVVRQGDVMAELRIHTGGDERHARDIVSAAAERLCAAAASC